MNTAPAIRVMVVDDHALLREGIAAVLSVHADIEIVAEACDGEDAVAQYRRHRPDLTLMDLQMPGMSGIDATQAIRREFPDASILVLTTFRGDAQALRALKAGACGFLLKSGLRRELIEAIRRAHAGQRQIPGEIASAIASHAADDALSAREVEILSTVAGGNSNKEVARRFAISEETVKTHMKNMLSKLGAKDRTHAVTIALRRGIIELQ